MGEFGRRKYRNFEHPETLSESMESVLSEVDELRRALYDVQEGKYSGNRDEELSVIINSVGGLNYCFEQLESDLKAIKAFSKTVDKLKEYKL